MGKRRTSQTEPPRKCKRTGREARAGRQTLRSEKIGALPIINHFLKRLRLEEWLQEYLPPEDKRVKIPASKALLVLVRNLLVPREPLYGIGEWAAGYAPDLLGLPLHQLEALSDAARPTATQPTARRAWRPGSSSASWQAARTFSTSRTRSWPRATT